MRTVAIIPVHGRSPLVKITIERLLHSNKCEAVICVGSNDHDKQVCTNSGALWVDHDNYPLGKKWNSGFIRAKELNPDAVLFVGSSDWVSSNWIESLSPYLKSHALVGPAGCWFGDFNKQQMRLVSWPGYAKGTTNKQARLLRANEPIGIGRLLRNDLLEFMEWQPFSDLQDSSLDWIMYNKAIDSNLGVLMIDSDKLGIYALSISCDQWSNKHVFEQHWTNMLPSHKLHAELLLTKHFPQWKELYKNLYSND